MRLDDDAIGDESYKRRISKVVVLVKNIALAVKEIFKLLGKDVKPAMERSLDEMILQVDVTVVLQLELVRVSSEGTVTKRRSSEGFGGDAVNGVATLIFTTDGERTAS